MNTTEIINHSMQISDIYDKSLAEHKDAVLLASAWEIVA